MRRTVDSVILIVVIEATKLGRVAVVVLWLESAHQRAGTLTTESGLGEHDGINVNLDSAFDVNLVLIGKMLEAEGEEGELHVSANFSPVGFIRDVL